MKISLKLEYACRALTQLAQRHDGRTLTRLDELAQLEAVSPNFLVQIMCDLRRGGLVESCRGRAGGYVLGREPGAITLRHVVEAVDPALLQCSVTGEGKSGLSVRHAWEQVSTSLQQALDQITLETLAAHPGGPMFYI